MTSRRVLTTIGATALGIGIVLGGGTAIPAAFAQESTPAAEAPTQAEQPADREALRAQAYDAFVAALAKELNVDDSRVDTAIRSALKAQVDEQEAAGNIDADLASELQSRIDDSDAPLMFGFAGPAMFGGTGEMHGFGNPGGFIGRGGEHHGPREGFGDRQEAPEGIAPPATLPASGDASNQSAPTTSDSAAAAIAF
jgi:hypothetical protein